jgi:branched-chain amino acid transport system substrate-binding protein
LPDEIVVGSSLPLSGKIAFIGIDARRGMELAVRDARALLGGSTLAIDFRDDAFEKEQSIVNFDRIMASNPAAIIGPLGSLISSAALPIAQSNSVPAVTLSAPDNGLTDIGEFIFSSLPMMSLEGPGAALNALDAAGLSYSRPAIAKSEDYQTGLIYMEKMVGELAGRGVEPVREVTFFEADTNFSTQVTAIKDAEPDAVFISGGLPAIALLVKQLRASGVTATVVGDIGTTPKTFLEQAGDSAEGVVGIVYWQPGSPGETETSKTFYSDYVSEYGEEPTLYSAVGYDTVMSVAHAVRQAGSVDPTAIRDALANLKPFEGVMGPTNSYSEARTMTSSPVAVVWTAGALELLDESYLAG